MRVALVLSGCGFLDGSEIHEAVLALAALDRAGASVTVAAPDAEFDVVDHRTAERTGERRNALAEAARIARGRIVDLATLAADDFDAVVMPGGYGAAQTLSDFESAGAAARVRPELARLLLELHRAGKPIGAICIAPALVAAVLRDAGVRARLTLGEDAGVRETLGAMGQHGVDCRVDQCVVDEEQRVACTPAYMHDARIADVAAGVDRLVGALVRLAKAARASS